MRYCNVFAGLIVYLLTTICEGSDHQPSGKSICSLTAVPKDIQIQRYSDES